MPSRPRPEGLDGHAHRVVPGAAAPLRRAGGQTDGPDRIVMASDHRGAALKGELRQRLEAAGHTVVDMGTDGDASVDYPDFAAPAARSVSQVRRRAAFSSAAPVSA